MRRIFKRTGLGEDVLGNPGGRLRGDEERLLALIDGRVSVEDICIKVPLSVQLVLDEMFARLISAHFIAEAGSSRKKSQTGLTYGVPKGVQSEPNQQIDRDFDEDKLVSVRLEVEVERRIELERELAGVRAELAAMVVREQRINTSCLELRQKIASHTESMQAKLAEKSQTLTARTDAERGLLASFESELREFIDVFGQLSQATRVQTEQFDKTLELTAFNVVAEESKRSTDGGVRTGKNAQSYPQYCALRGLEFFKSFGNSELLNFLSLAKWQEVKAGETVLCAGEVGLPFFVIVSGSVSVFEGGSMLASLDRGDAFGELSHLSGEVPARSAYVVTATDCELLVLEPLDIEFSGLQMRLLVAEALLRGQARKLLRSNQVIRGLYGHLDGPAS